MPRYFKDYVEASVEATQGWSSPELFRRWSAVSAVAGALGRKCWYDRGDFKCRANMYIVLVGGPATGKSLSMDFQYSDGGPYYRLSTTPKFDGENEAKDYNEKWKKYLQKRTTPLVLAYGSFTSRDLVDVAATVNNIIADIPIDDIIDDATLTVYTSEFGTLINRHDEKLYMMLTEGWDASKPYYHRTAHYGKRKVPGYCLNWAACATPGQFVEKMPANAAEQGLLSRIIPVYYTGKSMGEVIHVENRADERFCDMLATDLAEIAEMHGEFAFSEEAAAAAQKWLDGGKLPAITEPMMYEYDGRRFSHLLKLCMVFSAARRRNKVIELRDWESAQELLFEAEANMPALLKRFGMSMGGKFLDDIEEFVARKGGEVSQQELTTEARRLCKNLGDIKAGIDLLKETGRVTEIGAGIKRRYRLNA